MDDASLHGIRDIFDERSATYDDGTFHRDLAGAVVDFADLTDVGSVLDVATGTGLVLRAVDARAAGLVLTGADISPGMLAVARDALPRARWVEADAAALPFPDASVDLISCVTALHIIPDTAAVTAEWRRMLRPGGRVVTATFLRGSRQPGPANYRGAPVDHESFHSADALRATFAPLGLAVIRYAEWGGGDTTMLLAELAPSDEHR